MIGIGSATKYSLLKSQGSKSAEDYFSNAIIWTVLVSLPFVAAGILSPQRILYLLGPDGTIVSLGETYIRIILCCTPLFMLNYTFTAFVRNDGAPRIAMAATLSSGVFNIIFDDIFMFPMGMGMAGAAVATAISPAISMAICLLHYLSARNTIRLVPKIPSLRKLTAACILGIVAFVGEISNGITTIVFNFILLALAGNTGVAVYGIVANLALVGTALFNGLSQGLQLLASTIHGKWDLDGEKRIYRHSPPDRDQHCFLSGSYRGAVCGQPGGNL